MTRDEADRARSRVGRGLHDRRLRAALGAPETAARSGRHVRVGGYWEVGVVVHALTVSQVGGALDHKKVLTDPHISINTQEVINRTKSEQGGTHVTTKRKEVHHYGASY